MTSKHSSTIGVVATLAVVVSSLVVVVPLASAFVATTPTASNRIWGSQSTLHMSSTASSTDAATTKKGKRIRKVFSFDIPPPLEATEAQVSAALAAHDKNMEKMKAKDQTSKALTKEVSYRMYLCN